MTVDVPRCTLVPLPPPGTQRSESAAYGGSNATPQGSLGSSLGLALLHQRVGGVYSMQHLSDRLLQPEHHRCLLPQAAGPPHIQHSQLRQGRGLPRNRTRGERSDLQDCITRSSTPQSGQRLPDLAFWTKVGVCGDSGVWLHRAQIQQRHQDCIRQVHKSVRLIMGTANELYQHMSKIQEDINVRAATQFP